MAEHIYLRHSTEMDIPFFDVDSLWIVWHGHYVKYLEVARCALLDAIGYDYTVMRRHGFAFPVVKLDVKYVKPAAFRQRVRVECALTEYESALKIHYRITDAADGRLLTKASTMQVAVCAESGEMQFQTPPSWQEAVRAFAGFNPPPSNL